MKRYLATLLVVSTTFTGTMFAQDTANTRDKTKRGAIIGAVAGGVLGAVVGNNRGSGNAKRGAIVGTVAGTAIGAGIGAYMDKQERELRQIEGLEVRRTDDDELNVVVKNEILFDYNSSSLRSASRDTIREMSDVFERYSDTTIAIEGHTDSVGSASYNERLSSRRAGSVASYLRNLGVDRGRLDTIAQGESDPRASNSTASGRQLNRRVEIRVRANS